MREFIKLQLKKCSYADLSHYDESTGTFLIPKYSKPKYTKNKMYIIQLPAILVNNINTALAANWNKGTAPQTQYLKIYVSNFMGKMIYVDSIGYDINTQQDIDIMWSGWLPTEEITQIAEI